MKDVEIVNLYKSGKSIDYITNQYYKYKNLDIPQNHYQDGNFIITKKNVKKNECREHVEKTIINFIKLQKKERYYEFE